MTIENNYEKKLLGRGLWEPLTSLLASTTDNDKIETHKLINQSLDTFTPSIYSAIYIATTTVENEILATGTKKISIYNKSTNELEYITIGFGDTAIEAQNAANNPITGNSVIVLADSYAIISTKKFKYMAWVSNSGTVSLRITQGI
jgi:hypothetical protein